MGKAQLRSIRKSYKERVPLPNLTTSIDRTLVIVLADTLLAYMGWPLRVPTSSTIIDRKKTEALFKKEKSIDDMKEENFPIVRAGMNAIRNQLQKKIPQTNHIVVDVLLILFLSFFIPFPSYNSYLESPSLLAISSVLIRVVGMDRNR